MKSELLFDLSRPQRIHVVGVGGPGMSAIAQVLHEMGNSVSGSDIKDSVVVQRLRDLGVVINVGHDAQVVNGCDAVTASTAIPLTNIEMEAARSLGIAVLTRAQILASICAQKSAIGVAGTHGKTTTSSMLMTVLRSSGARPSFIIGGDVHGFGTGASWDSGQHLVVEADESDGTHEQLPLFGTIVTNIDIDHLDHFSTFDNVVNSFEKYLSKIHGPKVVCADDQHLQKMSLMHHAITYGMAQQANYVASNIQLANGGSQFDVVHYGKPGLDGVELGRVQLRLRGKHNVSNALGVIAMAHSLGIDFVEISKSLSGFSGVARRFDFRGVDDGVTFVDDYAHLPTEIEAVLSSSKDSTDTWSRRVAVFQPNRFNRMEHMSGAYADCFTMADHIVITDIYSSGTNPIPGVTGKLIVDAILGKHPNASVAWKPTRGELIDHLAHDLRTGDLCISMGCGDIELLPDEVIAARIALRSAT